MGAGASSTRISEHINAIGGAYAEHARKVVELGVDGPMVEELQSDADMKEALDSIGVNNVMQRKRLMRGDLISVIAGCGVCARLRSVGDGAVCAGACAGWCDDG